MSSTDLLLKFIGKVYLGRYLFLIVLVLEAYSFSITSSINECKWSKCISPLLLSRIFSIHEATFLKFFFLERLNKFLS